MATYLLPILIFLASLHVDYSSCFQKWKGRKKSKNKRIPPIFVVQKSTLYRRSSRGLDILVQLTGGPLEYCCMKCYMGNTPFRGKTRQKTFANILQKDLKFPASIPVSFPARQLMYLLVHRDPRNRLGSCEGANEIKQHPFFRGVNWALVRCKAQPRLDAPLFDKEILKKTRQYTS